MILVTGGMGFIGLHVARSLLDAGEDVVLTRFRRWRLPEFLEPELGARLRVEDVDLGSGWLLLDAIRRHGVTGIVHLATPPLGPGPAHEYGTAVQGLLNVLEAARQLGVYRVTVASSVNVYSGVGPGPWREEMPLPVESDSHTSAAKKAVEVLGLHFAHRTGLDVRLLRLAAIYGPMYHSLANLPSRLCHAAVSGSAADLSGVRVGTPYAEDASDLCYVRDCADGIRRVQLAVGLRRRVYNLGGGGAVTNGAIAEAVRAAVPGADVELPSHQVEPGAARPYMDIAHIQEETGYAPSHDIFRGVADYVEWLRGHPE